MSTAEIRVGTKYASEILVTLFNIGGAVHSYGWFIVYIWCVSQYVCYIMHGKLPHILRVSHQSGALLSPRFSPSRRALRIVYGDQIKGMPYQNTLFLANIKSKKTVKLNSASPFSSKYSPLTAACLLSSHLNAIMKSSPNYVNPWNI